MSQYGISENWRMRHPSLMIVSGPTNSGKSTFVLNLLKYKNTLIDPLPERIIFIFSENQPDYFYNLKNIVPHIEFYHGLENAESIISSTLDEKVNNLIIIDDLLYEALQSKFFLDLTTKVGHHKNASIIFIMQNIYAQSKFSKTISDQAKYLVLFRNVRDKQQISNIGRQIFGTGSGNVLSNILWDVTNENKYGYIIVDMHHLTDDNVRIFTSIFPHESPYQIGFVIYK